MDSKRLSLYGIDPKEAIRAALNTPPPKRSKVKKKAAKRRAKK